MFQSELHIVGWVYFRNSMVSGFDSDREHAAFTVGIQLQDMWTMEEQVCKWDCGGDHGECDCDAVDVEKWMEQLLDGAVHLRGNGGLVDDAAIPGGGGGGRRVRRWFANPV